MKPDSLCLSAIALLFVVGSHLSAVSASGVVVVGDSDRDGSVSFTLDVAGRAAFTEARGAVVMPNNDDDDSDGEPDHSDGVVNGPGDIDDLAPVLIAAVPALAPSANLTVSVDAASVAFTRLFLKNASNNYVSIASGAAGNIPGAQARAGTVELRVEALSHPTTTWNGRITLTVAATDGTGLSPAFDSIQIQTTPFLLSPSTAPATELYVRAMTGRNETFVAQLQALAPAAGITVRVSPASAPYQYNDCWMQDAFEPGYTQGGGRWQNVVLKANRGSGWLLSNFAKDELLAPGFGWISVGTFRSTFGGGGAPNGWLDWFGNLEVSPPLPNHPFGRIYYGANGANSLDPAIVNFLNAQNRQGPALAVDVGWLLIKHVDEMTCWVPTGNPSSPYKLLVPDTTLMAGLLDSWVAAGHGSRTVLPSYISGLTVSSMASNTTRRTFNLNLQSTRINPAIESMKSGFALAESDIIRVPSWYYSDGSSYVPSMVNSAVANGHLLVSNPQGPVVGGVDLLQQDLRNRLAALPLTIHFLNDEQYHKWSGNVHCATNVRRQPAAPEIFPPSLATVRDWSLY